MPFTQRLIIGLIVAVVGVVLLDRAGWPTTSPKRTLATVAGELQIYGYACLIGAAAMLLSNRPRTPSHPDPTAYLTLPTDNI